MRDTEKWDGSFRNEIQCPHCGALDEERCDYPESLRHDGDTSETDCGVCEKPMRVTLSVSYTYSTEPVPEPDAKE
jgi:hypothetical protein